MAGIYLHIPFCNSICKYCDFYRTANLSTRKTFLQALYTEIKIRSNEFSANTVDTIYFGGGTPSILQPTEIAEILQILYKNFNINNIAEITLELNPENIQKNYLEEIKQLGINRLSIGIQSFHNDDLEFLGRKTSRNINIKALETVKTEGFENVSIDLIYGFELLSKKKLEENLKIFSEFNFSHLSAYHLIIEEGSVFYKLKNIGKILETKEETSEEHFRILQQFAQANEYEHYEISNFSKAGKHSRHNTSYWFNIPYLGFGPSAHSYVENKRSFNQNSVLEYIQNIENGILPSETEILTETDKYNELIMTRLRTKWGIEKNYIENTFSAEIADYFQKNIQKYLKSGKIVLEEGFYKIPCENFLISDNILAALFIA